MTFPIDIKQLRKFVLFGIWVSDCFLTLSSRVSLDPKNPQLTDEQRKDLLFNIQLLRDVVVLFTASAAARGVSGHTGGAYDTIPEVTILLSLFEGSDKYVKIFFDEAGAISPGGLEGDVFKGFISI